MTTFPDIPFDMHMQGFLEWLDQYYPAVGSMTLRWYDYYDSHLDKQGRVTLPRTGLGTVATLEQKFEQLKDEGKAWINLCAIGALNDHEYVISVEYNLKSNGHPVMAVNRSGPPIDINGSVCKFANVSLVDS